MAEKKVSKTIDREGKSVNFEFADGSILEAKLTELPDEIKTDLALHGMSQKIGDSYAGEDAANCETIAAKVYEQLQAGNWSVRTGGGGPRISQLADALSRVTGQPIEACVEKIADMDDDTKKSLRAHKDIKKALAQIKLEQAEEAARKADADSGGDDEQIDLTAL